MFAFVPTMRTLKQCFIVSFFALLNDPLETDVSTDLVASLIQGAG